MSLIAPVTGINAGLPRPMIAKVTAGIRHDDGSLPADPAGHASDRSLRQLRGVGAVVRAALAAPDAAGYPAACSCIGIEATPR
jgi:hypothetical protein